MPTMDRDARLLQLLKAEFTKHLPWLSNKSGAVVTIRTSGDASFSLVATWAAGEHTHRYGVAIARTLGGRGNCPAKLAEAFILEVQRAMSDTSRS